MKKKEALIITAYTGTLLCDFDDFQKFASGIVGRDLFTHELVRDEVVEELKRKTKDDFIKIMENLED